MFTVFRTARREYPSQYWLMFWGMLLSTIGASMIWPFLMIYVSEKLSLSMSVVTSLLPLNALMSLTSSFIGGPIMDRFGRKWVMIFSLAMNGIAYFLMSQATAFYQFAVLMALTGAFNPLYRVSADAMMADLIPPEKRIDAYSLLRMINNLGVAIGPTVGGFIASTSYTGAFICAGTGMCLYALLMFVRGQETLQKGSAAALERRAEGRLGGYGYILKDKTFMWFAIIFTFNQFCSSLVWVLMSVYTKHNYGIPERQYGFLPATNAVMVVTLQMLVTQMTRRHPPFKVLALGSLFYTVAVGSVAFDTGFWGFWVSIVVMTIGELILMPTSTTLVANMAPPDMRGRYMGIYTLSWTIASGIAPMIGGLLNDNLGPAFIWYGGAVFGAISVTGMLLLSRGKEAARAGELERSG